MPFLNISVPNVSFQSFAPGFVSRFIESHAVMLQGNAGLKPKEGEYTSRPWEWPINLRVRLFLFTIVSLKLFFTETQVFSIDQSKISFFVFINSNKIKEVHILRILKFSLRLLDNVFLHFYHNGCYFGSCLTSIGTEILESSISSFPLIKHFMRLSPDENVDNFDLHSDFKQEAIPLNFVYLGFMIFALKL